MFATWFEKQLRRQGLTERDVAEQVGVSQQAVSRWRKGEARPGGQRMGKLARALGASIEELITAIETDEDAMKVPVLPRSSLLKELKELQKRLDRLERLAGSSQSKQSRTAARDR